MTHVVDMEVQVSDMLGVKVIEVNKDNACEKTYGIVELYMYTEYCENPVITIEFPDGKTDSFDGYYFNFDFFSFYLSLIHISEPTRPY